MKNDITKTPYCQPILPVAWPLIILRFLKTLLKGGRTECFMCDSKIVYFIKEKGKARVRNCLIDIKTLQTRGKTEGYSSLIQFIKRLSFEGVGSS